MRSEIATAREIETAFKLVEGLPWKGFTPDDWRKPRPTSFNCSSCVQWLARVALGWSTELVDKYAEPNARALVAAFEDLKISSDDLRAGDVVVYREKCVDDEPDDWVDDSSNEMHVMMYIGNETVVGACTELGSVVKRPAKYDERWDIIKFIRISR
jgi:cell wall-associated NlpC family hydrolase